MTQLIDPALPLIDLHRHLDGSLRLETILDLGRQHNLPLPAWDMAGLRPEVQVTTPQPGITQVYAPPTATETLPSATPVPSLTPIPTRQPSATPTRSLTLTPPTALASGTAARTASLDLTASPGASLSPAASLAASTTPFAAKPITSTADLDGLWTGFGSANQPITFTVVSQQVVSLAYQDSFSSAGCYLEFLPTPLSFPSIVETATAVPLPTIQKPFSLAIENNGFSIEIQTPSGLLRFSGSFGAQNTASGELYRFSTGASCPFNRSFTWKAEKP